MLKNVIVQQHYEKNKDAKKLSVRQHYEENKNAKILCVLQRYEENEDVIKLSVRQHYEQNKDAKKLSVKQYYERNKDAKLVMRKLYYQQNKECTKIYHKNYYTRNRDKLACKTKLLYSSNRDFAKVVLKCARKYYARNGTSICTSKKRRYNLAEPKPCIQQQYVLTAKKALLLNKKVMKVINYYNSQQEGAFEKMNKYSRTAAMAQVAAHMRKQYVGLLLKTVKHV